MLHLRISNPAEGEVSDDVSAHFYYPRNRLRKSDNPALYANSRIHRESIFDIEQDCADLDE